MTTRIRIGEQDIEADGLDLPPRQLRNAWVMLDDLIAVDMLVAREIWREKLRQERAPLMAALDVEWLRAAEAGDTDAQEAVKTQKQVLRDLPNDPRIAKAATPEALLTLTMKTLKG